MQDADRLDAIGYLSVTEPIVSSCVVVRRNRSPKDKNGGSADPDAAEGDYRYELFKLPSDYLFWIIGMMMRKRQSLGLFLRFGRMLWMTTQRKRTAWRDLHNLSLRALFFLRLWHTCIHGERT